MKIACFHLNQVGDLAFSLPALKCIRDSFPDAVITSILRPGAAELLQCTDLVDEILIRRGGFNRVKIKLERDLASKKFDLAVVFSQSAECAALAYFSGAPKRCGFINTSLGFLLTHQVDFSHPPSTQNNLRLVAEIGCDITQRDYVGLLQPSMALRDGAEGLLGEHGIKFDEPLVVFSPGTSGRRSVKEWTDEGFAAVGDYLTKRGYRVVILGTQPVYNIVKECGKIIDLSGKTNLGEALAILWRSKTLVAVDSGIMHLAAAAGTKVVGLYGPSNHKITGPQGEGHVIVTSGEECSPCVKTECNFERKCMTNIDAQQVIDAVEIILSQ
ncbi:MAG: glycosyltransferase family 9 protein [Armatimonadetes bacterium]|nr:glycosyltransferase family 9 protein [Armatimonadota bacterium]